MNTDEHNLSKVTLEELKRRMQIVEWQIPIAKDRDTLQNREKRLKELKNEIIKRQPIL